MQAGLAVRPEPNVRVEMKAHRERLKQAVHPGMTQREAGFTNEDRVRLASGVCADLGAAVGIWNGLKYAAVLWIVVLAVALFGYALTLQSPAPVSQTVLVR